MTLSQQVTKSFIETELQWCYANLFNAPLKQKKHWLRAINVLLDWYLEEFPELTNEKRLG